ncbi:M23 family metallopeptidase [Agrococcus sp. HG114]|uniref:M23 family metallopeptidase n=1 Tax=Agrococcus sp. HG114 TaxID=2969757 RepID=UPI00215A6601|nr:peptidoglycan DD-metalloendopeptidase family protein [Agrococcus sp. HG114]MCR8670240.1 peptidoglycan DD-metalloendopeptidase family protein [Agrococcus sp. HG114]
MATDARRLAQRISAGASLLVTASMVLVPALPAAAVQPPVEAATAVVAPERAPQRVDAVAGEPSVLARDDIVVREAPEVLDSGALSPARIAELQAVADSEVPGSSYGGDPAFPKVWAMLSTSAVQTPFPSRAQLPVSSGFGYRGGGFHGGTDIALPAGEEIRPIANGVVSEVFYGDNPGGGGYSVFIDHNIDGQFVQSWYGHLLPGSIRVEVGQVVSMDTVIAQLGSSGRSTGPHLHLELKNADYVSFDPALWLTTRQVRLEVAN